MDPIPLHPKLVHLPIALAVLMPLVTSGVLLAWWRGWLPRRVWVIAIVLQALLAGSGFAAMQAGEREEERVAPIVAEQYIEAHEEAAEVFVWASAVLLVVMMLAMVPRQERGRLAVATVAVLGTMLVFGLGYRTGAAGGRLVYEHGAAQAYVMPGSGSGVVHPPNQSNALASSVLSSEEPGDDEQ